MSRSHGGMRPGQAGLAHPDASRARTSQGESAAERWHPVEVRPHPCLSGHLARAAEALIMSWLPGGQRGSKQAEITYAPLNPEIKKPVG